MPSPTSRMTFLGFDASILAASCAVLSGPDWPTATPVAAARIAAAKAAVFVFLMASGPCRTAGRAVVIAP